MQTVLNFAKILAAMAAIAFSFFVFGWWALTFMAIAVAWELAKRQTAQQAPAASAPIPPCESPEPHVVRDTSTWQERVEKIEAARGQQVKQFPIRN